MNTINVTYDLRCEADRVEAFAEAIVREQSVEIPAALLAQHNLPPEVLGQIVALSPLNDDGHYRLHVEYPEHLAANQLSQLLNLLYGNISIQNGIRISKIDLPESFTQHFAGPRYGLAGIRQQLGVYERPLLATAIKPRGAALDTLVEIAGEFALGGGDLVKDDHNLVDTTFEQFAQRVQKTQAAVTQANAETGNNTLYYPMLMPTLGELDRQVEMLIKAGVCGVLVCPFVIGLDVMRHLRDTYPLALLAHPAFAGNFFHDPGHGIEPAVLLGTLTRLAGADGSVFPNYGGRFSFSVEQCDELAHALRQPWHALPPAWPAPAGGMSFDDIPTMGTHYGIDTMFLVGGALLSHAPRLRDGVHAFHERIAQQFNERRETPQPLNLAAPIPSELSSACEFRPAASASAASPQVQSLLRFAKDFSWEGRPRTEYKADATSLPFEGVSRTELIGQYGESAAFDVRYFEIQPKGFSSREFHEHTHTIICVRGRGAVEIQGETITLDHLDIAYVPPSAVHQLRTVGDEPFGFLCVVDHDRDRPQAP